MKAIELYPYWSDNRGLLAEIVSALEEDDLDVRPAPEVRSLGDVVRHVIFAEEYWWRGGIQGEPFGQWRPADWDRCSDEEKRAYRRGRFPTVASLVEGLRAAHAPVEEFLAALDANDLCLKRAATWGEENTLRWIFWHLVEHDQHHRAQVYARVHMLGRRPPQIWPRIRVMGDTPAAQWRKGEAAISDIVPFWKQVNAQLRRAVSTLADSDLAFAPGAGYPTIHDLVLHIFIMEDFLIRQCVKGQMETASGRIQGGFWKLEVSQVARQAGPSFPTIAALLEGLDTVQAATRATVEGMDVADLSRTLETPFGPECVHHILWYAREHTVHHRAQLFTRMRMAGRTPPEI